MLVIASSFCFAQSGFKKVYAYDQYNKDWALVKTIGNTYGFIDRNGTIVVQPIYAKIEKFGKDAGEYALVKTIAGTYGFIDRNGKETIPPHYWTKQEAMEQLKKQKS